jgi:hypothetical protein
MRAKSLDISQLYIDANASVNMDMQLHFTSNDNWDTGDLSPSRYQSISRRYGKRELRIGRLVAFAVQTAHGYVSRSDPEPGCTKQVPKLYLRANGSARVNRRVRTVLGG